MLSLGQGDWSTSPLLATDFDNVYASNLAVIVGLPSPGFSMVFTGPSFVQSYFPTGGAPGTLNANLSNPTATSAGLFGGDVLALQLNVDFSNAGFLVGTSGIPFGNLVLTGFGNSLDGLTISQFLGDANTCLGGGACLLSVTNMDSVAASLDGSFVGGTPSTFAQTNLVAPSTVTPEPGTLLLLGTGLLGVVARARRKRLG